MDIRAQNGTKAVTAAPLLHFNLPAQVVKRDGSALLWGWEILCHCWEKKVLWLKTLPVLTQAA